MAAGPSSPPPGKRALPGLRRRRASTRGPTATTRQARLVWACAIAAAQARKVLLPQPGKHASSGMRRRRCASVRGSSVVEPAWLRGRACIAISVALAALGNDGTIEDVRHWLEIRFHFL